MSIDGSAAFRFLIFVGMAGVPWTSHFYQKRLAPKYEANLLQLNADSADSKL